VLFALGIVMSVIGASDHALQSVTQNRHDMILKKIPTCKAPFALPRVIFCLVMPTLYAKFYMISCR
jgi:hypothetical protein